ncbi:hypothetical protein BKP35_01245 [Anaerobacillus arseniciselenatis]|uniref:FAD/FMN-containing dehydrogenase n=1 Tax=Anaerobacillus arseniciselenatis TaxID=85682 RepID=A0A1S2LSY1_9BACI|nr:CUE domain-containing protein [Anaerobacillus arseniciselenatis]OIJ15649.1 hypothetical protein BKP35_01245 [Anaerobacillus arseniciselenatis]
MKKKLIVAITTTALVLGLGTVTLANSDSEVFGNFKDMLPFMQQMHPDLNEDQLEQMYIACHGENGQRGNGPGMMRGFVD